MSTPATTRNADPDPRYPVGRHTPPASITAEDREYAVDELALLPERLRNAVDGLNDDQIDTPYRDGGWTVRQLIHHIADSHMNAVIRFRFALTETDPVIKPYDEAAWAMLHDAATAPVEWSLELIESLHARWVMLLQQLTDNQWLRAYIHPENGRTTLASAVLLYAWHSRHHTAHITHLRATRDW